MKEWSTGSTAYSRQKRIPQEPDDSDDKLKDDDVNDDEEDNVPQVRHSTRIAGGVWKTG
jgi:hypothetical protein